MKILFNNGKIFTGQRLWRDASVLVEDTTIKKVSPQVIERSASPFDLESGWLVPAFIDLQIYGGNGKLFGEHPSVESLKSTYEYCLGGGTTHFMPTVATNSMEVMFDAIEAVKSYWQQNLPGVLGLHLEGPFINPEKRGAHIQQFIHSPSMAEVEELVQKGKDVVKMITLAPEICDKDVIEYLRKESIIISAGHSNATYQQSMEGFQNGIPLATHLFNAMSGLHHRAPGMVGAIFNSETAMASIVADGHHVDYAAINIAKKIMEERLFLITDAVTENKEGFYQHRLAGDKYVVADGTLSGSSLTILKAIKNCIEQIGIPVEEALRMGSLYPAKAVQMDSQLGKIEEGYKAELVWLNAQMELKGAYTNGLMVQF